MTDTALDLATGSGRITGTASDGGHQGKPLLVFIPGGSHNARYFDVGWALCQEFGISASR